MKHRRILESRNVLVALNKWVLTVFFFSITARLDLEGFLQAGERSCWMSITVRTFECFSRRIWKIGNISLCMKFLKEGVLRGARCSSANGVLCSCFTHSDKDGQNVCTFNLLVLVISQFHINWAFSLIKKFGNKRVSSMCLFIADRILISSDLYTFYRWTGTFVLK